MRNADDDVPDGGGLAGPGPAGAEAGHPDSLLLLGTLYARQEKYPQAVAVLRRAVARTPGRAEAFNVLGLALWKSGEAGEAIACFRTAVDLRPEYANALKNLAGVLAERGDHVGSVALFRRVLAVEAHAADIARCRAALEADATDIAALIGLGTALRAIGRPEDAAGRFRTALAVAPGCVAAARNLAQVLVGQGRVDEAVGCYRSVLGHDPDNPVLHLEIGVLLRQGGHYPDALGHLERACALQPDESPAHVALALVLQDIGRIGAAVAHLRRAIALAPDRPAHYLRLARLVALEADDPVLAAMRALGERAEDMDETDRRDIHFALGKSLADIGEHRRSFDHLLAANALHRRTVTYDEERVAEGMREARACFTAEAIERLARTGHPSRSPVFIVGMPRSGSTLVEQILASHPDVFGAGEVSTLADVLADAARRFPAWTGVAPLERLTEAERLSVAEDYLRRMEGLVTGWTGARPPARISNKTLGNYFYIGLIRELWPNARIVHTMRDPVDTCLSCFSIPFNAQDFTFDLGELGRRYRQYLDMMDHWRRVLPAGIMLDVRYEEVVGDVEAHARRIVAHCGLAWDDACLRFHESTRPVTTSSVAQVRRPIYRDAVGRWRPDDDVLRPLLDGLGMTGAG